MLDFFSIFSKGGILLWCFKGEATLHLTWFQERLLRIQPAENILSDTMLSAAEWETFTPTINELIKWEKFLLSNPCTIVHVSWVPKQLCFIDLWGVLHVCLFSYKNLSPGAFVSDLKASPRCVLLQERAGRANYWEKPGGQLALKYKLVGRHNHTISKYRQIFKRPVSSVVHISSISG